MAPNIKYSICSTIYNSANTLEEALEPLCNLGEEFEIIIIDNFSQDNTNETLKKYSGRVQFLQMKCSRGLGRQKAIELSNGEYIIQLDLDVKYAGLSNIIQENEKELQNYILNIQSKTARCNAPILIGKKIFFDKINGYPDLNSLEDIYLYKKAEAIGLMKYVENNYTHKCLHLEGKSSGEESRYERSIYKKIRRRAIQCRDLIFVTGATYREVMRRYKLFGLKKIYQGVPIFITGKFLSFFIKVPKLDEEITRIKEQYETKSSSD